MDPFEIYLAEENYPEYLDITDLSNRAVFGLEYFIRDGNQEDPYTRELIQYGKRVCDFLKKYSSFRKGTKIIIEQLNDFESIYPLLKNRGLLRRAEFIRSQLESLSNLGEKKIRVIQEYFNSISSIYLEFTQAGLPSRYCGIETFLN